MVRQAIFQITQALECDVEAVWLLLRDLALYESKEDEFRVTVGQLRHHLWGPRPVAGAFLARVEEQAVGVALHYLTFPSFTGQPSLFIEDLFVSRDYRRLGVGTALLEACTQEAMDRGCGAVRWWALRWNESAMAFYKSIGARSLDTCVVHVRDTNVETRGNGASPFTRPWRRAAAVRP